MLEDNEKFRIDDEFFLKEYLSAYIKVKEKPYIKLGDVVEVLTDYHANGSYEILNKQVQIVDSVDYAYMVRSTDLEKQDCTNNVKYVSKQAYDFLKKTTIVGGEFLINKIGSPGRCYLMPTLNKPVTLGMNLFMIRLKDTSKINNYFLWTYFNSSLGQKIIYRKVNGTVPMTIDKEAVRSLYVPILNQEFQLFIETTIKKSEASFNQSQELYQQAERVLLEELGLVGFKPSTQGVSIKTFDQSFGTTGRLDAEYYQPKYDEMVQHLYTAPHNRLDELVNIQKSIEPGSEHYADEGIPFLRVSDLNKSGITEPNKKLSVAFCKENAKLIQKLQPKKDTILFSKDGTVGIAHKLAEDKACITSGAVLHLTVKNTAKILPDYLTLVLNSSVVQLQAERDAGGSIIQHWRVSEIEEVVIPVFSIEKQQAIAGLVQESFRLKTQSEALLEIAKRGVELAIETAEAQAQSWMQSQLGSLNALLSFAPAYCQLPKV